MNANEARSAWAFHAAQHEQNGVVFPGVTTYIADEWKRDFRLAMDAQQATVTDPNSALPALLSTMIDPQVFKILWTPNKAVMILGEAKKGSATDKTIMFPVVEHVGEVTSYGDFSESGHTGVNTNFPQRQSYLYQTTEEYGDMELETAGLARINYVSEMDISAATMMDKFQNLSYFFGISGLQNYGFTNDPNLSAFLTPALKNYGHAQWVFSGQVQATANEVYTDITTLVGQLVSQTNGAVNAETPMVLAMSPLTKLALQATNAFGINVKALLRDNFPNLTIEDAVQYQQTSTTNPQGIAAGNLIQIIAKNIQGQDTGYCSFNEKMRSFPIVRAMSSYKKKVMGGTWGAIVRMPVAMAGMIGV